MSKSNVPAKIQWIEKVMWETPVIYQELKAFRQLREYMAGVWVIYEQQLPF